jgi:multidrug efflux system outer membrane protein
MRATFVLFVSLHSHLAFATELEEVLAAAIAHDPAIAAALARSDGARADVGVARGRLLPSLTASAGYVRNQYAGEITVPGEADAVVIQPIDQLDATLRLDVPLIDGPAIAATLAAGRCRDAGLQRSEVQVDEALLAVVRDLHDALAAQGAVEAARAGVAAQEEVLGQVSSRSEQGTAIQLDVLRARADLAAATQTLAAARAEAATAARRLAARTGLTGLPEQVPARAAPEGDLLSLALKTPSVVAAERELACRVASYQEVAAAYAPRVAGFAQERLTNATGFVGQPAVWSAGVQATWNLLDGGARESRLAGAAADRREAEATLAQVRQAAVDAVADAIDALTAAREQLDAATARDEASQEAARLSRERLKVGLSTGVEVSLATRDAQDAAVALARARAQVAIAVETLRAAAGLPLQGGA